MKLTITGLYLALLQLAAGAPVPLYHVQHISFRTGVHRPTLETAKPSSPSLEASRWKFSRPRVAVPEILIFGGGRDRRGGRGNDNDTPSPAPFDNRPLVNPPRGSAVLDIPRPLTTEFLLSLHHQQQQAKKGGEGEEQQRRRQQQQKQRQQRLDVAAGEDVFELTEMEIAIAIPTRSSSFSSSSRLGTPCQYARLSRERNDVLVVFLAVAFMFVVLILETWGSICRSASRVFLRYGAIRLEEDEGEWEGMMDEKARGELSIQADAEDSDKADYYGRIQAVAPVDVR